MDTKHTSFRVNTRARKKQPNQMFVIIKLYVVRKKVGICICIIK